MNLAISNIAWDASEEAAIAQCLEKLDVAFVEIAPTKVFSDPLNTTTVDRSQYIDFWERHGIKIVAFQSLLFGHPELQLFGGTASRTELFGVLSRMIGLAGQMKVNRLVFGSPTNRLRPDSVSVSAAFDVATKFFSEVGKVAADQGVVFCIEPNPPAYGCNFVTNVDQGLDLVNAVAHPGFGLHLDAAGMTLAGDNIEAAIARAGVALQHFHVSAEGLGPIEDKFVDHTAAATGLLEIGYSGFLSIEMKRPAQSPAQAEVERAVSLVRNLYGLHAVSP